MGVPSGFGFRLSSCLSACLCISLFCCGPALAQTSHALRPYAYLAEAKRAPLQYNFGLGKRPSAASSKLYSFGLGKRAIDYDEDGFTSDERNAISDEQEDDEDVWDEAAKRSRSYSFGVGKRTKQYGFGLGKRARTYGFGLGKRADRQLYSFGLGKKRNGERRFAFGLGKRSDADVGDIVDEDDTWSSNSGEAKVGKREVEAKDLAEVTATSSDHSTRRKRAAPMQYSFGLGKRPSSGTSWGGPQPIAFLDVDEAVDDGEDDLLADGGDLLRSGRAGMQYGFGIGRRSMQYNFGLGKRAAGGQGKRGPRQYGFGLGRRSMQYNFGIGKRSPDSADAPSDASAATAAPAQ